MLKQIIRKFLIALRIDLTKNLHYDRLTLKILDKLLQRDTNCIDIGCHKGEILEEILKRSPEGRHFAFEPIPTLYNALKMLFDGRNVTFSDVALSDRKGVATFNYVLDAPAYSGLKKRDYAVKEPEIEVLDVKLDTLDHVIPGDYRVDFIKLDVEGGEFDVLKGARQTMEKHKPFIIFEFGLGASDHYDVVPEKFFEFMDQAGYGIFLLQDFLRKGSRLSLAQFLKIYLSNSEYYFIAAALERKR
ncbi:MAG: FkbM family methyltransferase [bacterium]